MSEKVRILGVESSCDETSCAVVADGCNVLSNVVASQIELHARFGGVVPEIASRAHIEAINTVIAEALDQAVLDAYGFSVRAGSVSDRSGPLPHGRGSDDGRGSDSASDLLAQLLDLNLNVAGRIDAGKPVTAPGVPPDYPNPASLVTEDCIQPPALG